MKKNNKTIILNVRVTPEERGAIQKKAYSSFRTVSAYMRDSALDKKIKVTTGADDVAAQLRALGNNVNQLAKLANSGYISAVDLSGVREELKEVWRLLNSLVQDAQ